MLRCQGLPWIVPAVGYGVYGFAFSVIADLSLTYLLDCYQDVSLASGNRWQSPEPTHIY